MRRGQNRGKGTHSFLVSRRSSTLEALPWEHSRGIRDAGPSGLERDEVIVHAGEPPAHPSKEPI